MPLRLSASLTQGAADVPSSGISLHFHMEMHWDHEPLRRNSGTGVSPVRFVPPTHRRDARATISGFMESSLSHLRMHRDREQIGI